MLFVAMVAVLPSVALAKESCLTLATRGKPADCQIAVGKNPAPTVRRAAMELQSYTEQIAGVRLPVVEEAQGKSVRLRLVADGSLGDDGFRIVASENGVEILGGKRGVLYGVYELLETYGGVGWFAPWRTVVPERDAFEVPSSLRVEQKPAFRMRDTSWFCAHNPEFAAHLRINGPRRSFPPELCSDADFRFAPKFGICHTVQLIMPPEEFAAEHPEYYGLVDGKRVTEGRVQLCLTNPDVLRICKERVLEAVRKHPECRYFGVSQGDSTRTVCKCENCLASDRKYGDAPSGTFLAFVNAIAEEVEKVRPDAIVETLAYRYTRKPPTGIRPRRNVMPCLCTIECDYSRPIPESDFKENVAFLNDIKVWRKISPFLYIWDYTVNFWHYGYPFGNFKALQGNMRFFRESGVEMMFEQGDSQGPYAWFGELRTYLIAKLEWNPDADVAALTDRFFRNYYGPAADLARADFDEIHAMPRGGAADPVTIYERVDATNYPDAFFDRSVARWAEAAKRVEGRPEYARAVAGGRFSSDYVRVMRYLLKHGDGSMAFLTRDRSRVATPEMLGLVEAAKRIVKLLDDRPPVRLSEGGAMNSNHVARIRAFAKSRLMDDCHDMVQFGVDDFAVPARRAKRVKDADALNGSAYLFDGSHHQWSGRLNASRLVVDAGVKYRMRVRIKVKMAGDGAAVRPGEVFRAGVYDPAAKKDVGTVVIKAKDVKGDGYAWYDLFGWEPKGSEFFWISPGVFDTKKYTSNPAFTELRFDGIEIARIDGR